MTVGRVGGINKRILLPQKCAPPCACPHIFLLIMSSLYVLLEYLEDILTLLNPLLSLGGPIIAKYSVCESGSIIPIQSLERGHPNGHMVGGTVTMFTQV